MKKSLVAERLIKEKDIELKINIINIQIFTLALIFIIFLCSMFSQKSEYGHAINAILILITSFIIMIEIIYKLIAPSFNKTTRI